jgi:fengycin family lipopeptide synthetase D
VVAVLAVLKSGNTCLLLGQNVSSEFLSARIKDCGAKAIVTDNPKINFEYRGKIININGLSDSGAAATDLKIKTKPESPAFVFYTSGTTGKPKGVLLTHRGIINQIYHRINLGQVSKADILCWSSSPWFNITAYQLFTPLFAGSKLLIIPEEIYRDIIKLFEYLERTRVSFVEIVVSAVATYLNFIRENKNRKMSLKNLRFLWITAEKLYPDLVNNFYKQYPKIKLINAYGQPECCGMTLYYRVPYNLKTTEVFIGKPTLNHQAYILDSNRKLLPIGMTGELYISGDGLALGYLNKPNLTRMVFLPHPFKKGERIYKTGDRVKMHPDGNIEYVGRVDDQIKIRGQKVELSEIELYLRKFPGVKKCCVISGGSGAESYLVAYYESDKLIKAAELKEYLKRYLADSAIPLYYIRLDKIPVNLNDKLDRLNLPAPDETAIPHSDWEEPKTAIEKVLIDVWKEALKIDKISVNDNIFDLGGNSLKAIEAVAKLMAKKINIQLRDFFDYPRLKDLAAKIEDDLIGRHIYQAGE